jgi:hypothetical protein
VPVALDGLRRFVARLSEVTAAERIEGVLVVTRPIRGVGNEAVAAELRERLVVPIRFVEWDIGSPPAPIANGIEALIEDALQARGGRG